MKTIKGKIVYIFIAIAIFFVLLGSITISLIDHKLQDFNTTTLKKLANEKSLLVKQELGSVSRSLTILTKFTRQQQFALVNNLLNEEQLYNYVIGYSYSGEKGNEVNFISRNAQNSDSLFTVANFALVEEHTYYKINNDYVTVWEIPVSDYGSEKLKFFVSLKQLNSRFWNESLGSYAYIEVYDPKGICIISPDEMKIGTPDLGVLKTFNQKIDTVKQSEYLELPVLQKSYALSGIFDSYKMIVSVPLMIVANDSSEISHLIWMLWGVGIVTLSLFLFFIIKQNNKQYQLQMQTLAYQHEKATFELSNLKQKINPHFLFNTLGTLQQLIVKDPPLAKKFVTKLAKVYRKLLNVSTSGTSTLKDELDFMEEYFFLLKIRFGDTLLPLDLDIDEAVLNHKLPTLSLQMLIENAVKHNELTLEHPLSIHISANAGGVVVKNAKCLRNGSVDSEGYGSKVLLKTYQYYKVTGYKVVADKDTFTVYLPFIP